MSWPHSGAAPEQYHAQKIIIIHPGSLNLRIGRASDLNPVTLLHAIGRRRKQDGGGIHRDTLLPAVDKTTLQDFDEQRLLVSHTIQKSWDTQETGGAAASKRRRIATPPQQISSYNRRSVPEELPLNEKNDVQPKIENTQPENIFDADIVQNAYANDEYNVHFPMRRGQLHLHAGIGGSQTAVLTDLRDIWSYALRTKLGIDLNQLMHYSAVLVISDIYHRSQLKELITLLLQQLRFKACFLLQDHVAATFGAGLGYACVVDIGDQKCSISCVEDGISQIDTRVRLEYGGADVTQVFYTLLQKCAFPYRDLRLDKYADATLLTQLKERFCHVNLDVCGAQERNFEVQKPDKRLLYTLQLGDECVVAPLALLHTELMNITGATKNARLQQRSCQQPDSEDCFDAEYIRDTGRRNGRDQLLLDGGVAPITGEAPDDDFVVVDAYDAEREAAQSKLNDKDECCYTNNNGQIMSLDQAIVRSIERCANDELRRKMYGCILVVGGGGKFAGFVKWLERRIALQLQQQQQQLLQPFEVITCTKDMDAAMIAWKGAAIMSCLESANELWIYANEWTLHGLRTLREKAPFNW